MKNQSVNKSTILLIIVFILFVSVPFVVGITMGFQPYSGYVSTFILLIFTWYMYRKEGNGLSELGLSLKNKNTYFLPLGFIAGVLYFVVLISLQVLYHGIKIRINDEVDWLLLSGGIFFLLQSVLNEELIFRGYCLNKTMERVGMLKANLIFAFFFVVWHWVALSAWGNYGMMLSLGITGLGHFLFATSLLKSGTLFFPIGIHLGNNWAQRYLFSAGMEGINTNPSNDILFILTPTKSDFSLFHNLFAYLITIACFLVFIWILWKWKKSPTDIK